VFQLPIKGIHMQIKISRPILGLAFIAMQSLAAEPATGPVVENYGPVFTVPEDSFNLDPDRQYKIVMDIGKGPDELSDLNRNIETAARFLNMHSRNGIKPENLELAIVLHGSATHAALGEQAHAKHFDALNGSRQLIEALGNAGVDIYVCGQSAGYYGYGRGDLLSQVNMAVSAMTVHVRLQQEGYQAILF
jgi:intracellular sulfur oxidation DsrE/DsrF family protein